MNSREEILDLMNSYVFLIDQGDLQGFAALFEFGEWGSEGQRLLSGKEMLEMLRNDIIIYADGTPKTRHVVTNIDLDVDEHRGVASCRSYVTLLQQTEDFPLQVIFSGEYSDDFERIDDKWRFARRMVKRPLYGDLSRHVRRAIRRYRKV